MMVFPILNTNHKMTFTHTSSRVRAMHFCLGSWSLISKVWTLGTHFWKHYTIEIFLEGKMWWEVFLGCRKKNLKTFCSKVIFIFSFITNVTCCLLFNWILDGKDVHCWCKYNNVLTRSWISTRWNKV
jgi:hypothetical protein